MNHQMEGRALMLYDGLCGACMGKMLRAVPLFARNAAYRMFARNRYRLTAQYEVCLLPSEAERMKFVG